jgi:hypothetical protein
MFVSTTQEKNFVGKLGVEQNHFSNKKIKITTSEGESWKLHHSSNSILIRNPIAFI